MNKKSNAVLRLIGILLLTIAFCVLGYLNAKNIKLGLDLNGGVSITYQTVEENPTAEQMSDILDWVFETAGEPARSLAADLAAAYLGNHAFLIDDLDDWDAETKSHRAHMVFHGEDIRGLSARTVMKLRARAAAGF